MKTILDLDTGIDDALALAYALGSPELELIGVTGTYGNVLMKDGVANNLALLDLFGHADVPVFHGEPHASTKEGFEVLEISAFIHGKNGIGEVGLPASERTADERGAVDFLVDSVDPRPLSDMFVGLTPEPAHVETIEWFATPEDVCRTFAGLHEQAADPALAPLDGILSQQVVGIELDDAHWPTVWYKGGSEPGVLALGWLAVTDDGETHVVEMTATDPDEPLADDVITDLIDLAADAFALLA